MKRLVKSLINRLGYTLVSRKQFKVVPFDYVDPRLADLICSHATLLRDTIIPSLPELDPDQVRLLSRSEGILVDQALLIIDRLRTSLHLRGDVCEFGCANGALSAVLGHELMGTDKHKRLWLFDSFQGLPAPSAKDHLKDDIFNLGDMAKYEGAMRCPEASVRCRLREIGFPPERTAVVAGFIEETIGGPNIPQEVCFAFVDVDLYEPIQTALRFLDSRITPGGTIMVHDYDYFSTGVKTACDEFFDSHRQRYVREVISRVPMCPGIDENSKLDWDPHVCIFRRGTEQLDGHGR